MIAMLAMSLCRWFGLTGGYERLDKEEEEAVTRWIFLVFCAWVR